MELDDLLVQIDSLKAEVAELASTKPEAAAQIRDKFRLDFIHHSSALAGNPFTHEETKSLLQDGLMPAGGKPLRHADDLRGHVQALQSLETSISAGEPLTEAMICRWHTLLLRDEYEIEAMGEDGRPAMRRVQPGRLRTTPAFGRSFNGGVLPHPPEGEVAGKLKELLGSLGKLGHGEGEHAVEQSARLQQQFLAIHPFDDGNGRMARLLMNWVLMRGGFPPAVIRKQDRRVYEGVLDMALGGNRTEMMLMIARGVLDAQELALRAAQGESIQEGQDVEQALLSLKRDLSGVEEPQELNQARFTRVLTTSVGPLLIRLVEKLQQFDELYSSEKVAMASEVFSDTSLQATVPGPALSNRKVQVKKWLAEFPALMVMSSMNVSFLWEGFRKGGLNDFGTSVTIRFLFEKRKYHIQCEPLKYSRQLMYQQRFPEEDSRQFLNDIARHVLNQIQQELDQKK